jgi:hypothetical protein
MVLGLNVDSHTERARRIAAREIDYPCLFQAGGVSADYGVLAYPTLVLLDRRGHVQVELPRALQDEQEAGQQLASLEQALARELERKK